MLKNIQFKADGLYKVEKLVDKKDWIGGNLFVLFIVGEKWKCDEESDEESDEEIEEKGENNYYECNISFDELCNIMESMKHIMSKFLNGFKTVRILFKFLINNLVPIDFLDNLRIKGIEVIDNNLFHKWIEGIIDKICLLRYYGKKISFELLPPNYKLNPIDFGNNVIFKDFPWDNIFR